MNKIFVCCLLLVLCPFELMAESPYALFLDTRLLVMAHPLFSVFDATSNRFKGTSSEPILGGYQGVDEVVEQIKKLEEALLLSSTRLKEELKTVPLRQRVSVERKFLAEKKELGNKLESLKRRVFDARQVPILPGMTSYSSITPQVNDIMAAIRAVVKKLKNKYNTELIIDVSGLMPYAGRVELTESLLTNKHKQILDKNASMPGQYLEWLHEADQYWAAKLGVDAEVIPYGALDTRLEAVKLMEEEVKGYIIWSW
ncbi:MAG: hypothetical protein PHF29_07990 [Candidatus Riflebacteria bacterium]|nr:hypothetical protein [Candidatus Riflebacteria bacterium]